MLVGKDINRAVLASTSHSHLFLFVSCTAWSQTSSVNIFIPFGEGISICLFFYKNVNQKILYGSPEQLMSYILYEQNANEVFTSSEILYGKLQSDGHKESMGRGREEDT